MEHLCQRHRDGNMTALPLLMGDVEPTPVPQPPSLLRQAANFAKAVAGHVAEGMPTVSEEEYEARIAVCRTSNDGQPCEKLMVAEMRCAACGCSLTGQLLNKARWRDQACPLAKWPTLEG